MGGRPGMSYGSLCEHSRLTGGFDQAILTPLLSSARHGVAKMEADLLYMLMTSVCRPERTILLVCCSMNDW